MKQLNLDSQINELESIIKEYNCMNCHKDYCSCMKLKNRLQQLKKRKSTINILMKNGVSEENIEIIYLGGAVRVYGKYYYFSKSKKAKVKGNEKTYQMRGVQHFYDTFLRNLAND
jgi:hypothetical protein